MTDYEIVRDHPPRSRLNHPSVVHLARKMIFELDRSGFTPSPKEREAIERLRDRLDQVLDQDKA